MKLRYSVNREAMAGTSPGRQSGETAKSERIVPKGRQADPDKISVVPLGRLSLLDHGLASMAVTCHAFGIQQRNFKTGVSGWCRRAVPRLRFGLVWRERWPRSSGW